MPAISCQSLVAFMPCLSAAHLCGFLAYDILDQHRIFEPTCLDEFPNLKDFITRFEVIPLVLLLFISLLFPLLSDAFLVGTTMRNKFIENLVYSGSLLSS